MIETRYNMKGNYKKDEYQCSHCWDGSQPGGSLETSSHLLVCRAYSDLREGLKPEYDMGDRASYLRKVIMSNSLKKDCKQGYM